MENPIKIGISMDPAMPSTVTMESSRGKHGPHVMVSEWPTVDLEQQLKFLIEPWMLCTVCLGVVDAYDIFGTIWIYDIYIYLIFKFARDLSDFFASATFFPSHHPEVNGAGVPKDGYVVVPKWWVSHKAIERKVSWTLGYPGVPLNHVLCWSWNTIW